MKKNTIYRIRRILVPLICVLFTSAISGQSLAFNGGGAWNTSVGGVVSSVSGIQSLYANPAGLVTGTGGWGADVGIEQRFNLSELSTVSMGGYYAFDKTVIGASLVRFGYSDYAEQKINLTYARKLFTALSLGGNFTYIQYRLNEFGNKNLFSFDVGLKADVSKSLSVGFLVNNPASIRFNEDFDIPVRLAIGTNYHPSPKVEWLAEIEKIIDNEITIKSAIIYYPIQNVSLRVGGDLNRNYIGLGIGYNLNGFKINGAYSINQVLGNNPALSLSYEQMQ